MVRLSGTMRLEPNYATLCRKRATRSAENWSVFLPVLATIAFLTPLLGLLGTVAGMIDAFGTIASSGGYATVTELSGGVYKVC